MEFNWSFRTLKPNGAGKGTVDPTSFMEALFAAIHIVKNRREQADLIKNQLRSGRRLVETAGDIKDDAN